eukprot:GGOE01011752.1.p1 GENE.GGOE01011752.1~~GGOE01011752.1.p1  ORF type:complete len:828 (-),score=230.42 GGOE01011752.1:172-2535(-)
MDELFSATTKSTDSLGSAVQDLLVRNSLQFFNSRIAAGDMEALSQEALLYSTGLGDLDWHPNATDINARIITPLRGVNFNTMTGNPMFSYLSMQGAIVDNKTAMGRAAFWIVWQVLNYDFLASAKGISPYTRTIYFCTVELSKDEQWDTMKIWYPDQTTGNPLVQLSTKKYPWQNLTVPNASRNMWAGDLYVNVYSGQVELYYVKTLHFGDQMYSIGMGMNTQSLGEELRTQLAGRPDDRLFLFFRNGVGHLIAASHGKYHSLSDVDSRYVNILTNPPNLSAYRLYTCLDSTDSLILEACRLLLAQYGNWTDIPPLHQEAVLAGRRYWVAVGYSSSSLNATMVLLRDRQSVMGAIDASNMKVVEDTDEKRGDSAAVLGAVTALAAFLPLMIGLWFGHRLRRLAEGMDRIAKLEFRRASLPEARFRELHNFQQSFLQMERGLRAFGRFVPQAVVTQLVAGHINTDDQMDTETVTMLFADIEGFSTWCEVLPSACLVEVCSEYFEVLCRHVVTCDGTIDKFIGDCIMAIWNAPLQLPGHERDAVEAALAMQTGVIGLHPQWRERDLPLLKFRLGIHTGSCLVGNFGCSHRVSYTCLGDSVNLSARLEALNKKFGTYICVSQATYEGCSNHFHFRRLAKVTVPGKSEVLPVFEVLCHRDPAEVESPRLMDVPGFGEEAPPSPSGFSCSPRSAHIQVADSGIESPKGDNEDAVPWHWSFVDRGRLLSHAETYHAAYEALVAGSITRADGILRGGRPPRDLPDKAWAALAYQLEHMQTTGLPWDGVFYFTEK